MGFVLRYNVRGGPGGGEHHDGGGLALVRRQHRADRRRRGVVETGRLLLALLLQKDYSPECKYNCKQIYAVKMFEICRRSSWMDWQDF